MHAHDNLDLVTITAHRDMSCDRADASGLVTYGYVPRHTTVRVPRHALEMLRVREGAGAFTLAEDGRE